MSRVQRIIVRPDLVGSESQVASAPGPYPMLRIHRGLGDVVYRVAHPIGCWLDRRTAGLGARLAWAKTGLCGCSACSRRRARWNALLPDLKRWKGGWQVACSAVARAVLRGFLGLIDRLF